MSYGLPPTVAAHLDAALNGRPRAPLIAAAAALSAAYRADRPSAVAITSPDAALAYACVRLPATFAAVSAALREAARLAPKVEPKSVFDLGFGTGAATLAAQALWSDLAKVSIIEPNRHLAAVGRALAAAVGLAVEPHDTGAADIALMSYIQVECAPEVAKGLVAQCLSIARDLAVFVEPGTPAGFARIRATRDVITAAGWFILAPCPHPGPCPLAATDWCHFKTRLPRTKTHRELKGGDVPFEDEPFSYVIASRRPHDRPTARILRSPAIDKGLAKLELCTSRGVESVAIPRRDKAAYKQARRAAAGEPWSLD